MKKILNASVFIAALACINPAIAGEKKLSPKKVPAGRTYVQLDAKGKEMNRFAAGQSTTLGTDCAQIKCPDSFGADVTCWKCVESVKTK